MWLIDTRSYKLKYFQDAGQVAQQYAILSHRWEEDEVSHSDMMGRWDRLQMKRMKGWYKIQKCCEQALKDNLSYAWVDTCCIDKTSSAELQEAINSMFRWYAEAKVCYVFLADVVRSTPPSRNGLEDESLTEQFRGSQWFTRGWTLQELLAPKKLEFFDSTWRLLGTRSEYKDIIDDITGIPSTYVDAFEYRWALEYTLCAAEVMSWAAGRKTTRIEDRAYSLIGMLGISMPLLYGEGDRAFRRLQEELLRSRDDQSIFAFRRISEPHKMVIPLCDTPDNFVRPQKAYRWLPPSEYVRRKPHIISNEGINVEVQLLPVRPGVYHAMLNAVMVNAEKQHLITTDDDSYVTEDGTIILMALGFPIREIDIEGRYVRLSPHDGSDLIHRPMSDLLSCRMRQVTLVNYLKRRETEVAMEENIAAFLIPDSVSDLWSLSKVDKDIDLPQLWPWQPAEMHVVQCPKAEAIGGLLTWNGWPQRLYWGYNRNEVSAIAFGYDFDFNPTCVVVLGKLPYDEKGLPMLQEAIKRNFMLDVTSTRHELDFGDGQKVTIKGGGMELTWSGGDLTKALLYSKDHEDLPILLTMKTTNLRRSSGEGFSATFHLDNSSFDHYYKGKVHISVRRAVQTEPWRLDIEVERGETKVVVHSIAPQHRRLVRPRPAYVLGTWNDAHDTTSPDGVSSSSVRSGRESSARTESDAGS